MEMNYDEKTLHELEQELHVEILPGTEIMTDVGSHHFVKASTSSSRMLVPQPSDNPHDPLNWSTTWKIFAIVSTLTSTFSQGFGPLALGPMFGCFIEDFHSSLADVVQFVGVCILVLGYSNLFWVPISSMLGRRPVLLASTLICLISNIWRAEAKTYASFTRACALNGFGAGPAETIAPTVIADIFFLHDRGKYNTLYFVLYFGSLMAGPIVAGPMADHSGWRKSWWLNVGLLALTLIMLVFLFPETKWHRIRPSDLAQPVLNGESGLDHKTGVQAGEYEKTISPPDTDLPALANIETALRDPFLGKLLAFPIVQLASFIVSWSASCFLTVNLTQAQNFAAPPYNYTSEVIGFFNFALLVGTFIGLLTAGPLSDWISMKLTLRNNGIREPEMRLIAMIPYVCIMILGNVIVAVGYQRSWSWKVIVIIGYTCAGIQVAALPAISSTYAVDSYKPVAGAIFVSITINGNLWGHGFSKFITPWILKAGYSPPIMTNMAQTTLWCLFGVLFWYKGKTFRKWSRNSKVHRA